MSGSRSHLSSKLIYAATWSISIRKLVDCTNDHETVYTSCTLRERSIPGDAGLNGAEPGRTRLKPAAGGPCAGLIGCSSEPLTVVPGSSALSDALRYVCED
eukprot:701444-Pleurochrysis_carterae.AAC.3